MKVNKKGRNNVTEHWTKMERATMQTDAWAALSTTAQALYVWVKFEWKGSQFNNNGRISLSVRQAAQKMGVGVNTAARAFQDLQAKGFLVVTKIGQLGVEGEARGPTFEITELKMPGSEKQEGRKLYKKWRPSHDLEVIRHNANNPNGVGGKNKIPSSKLRQSCPQNDDVLENPVIETKTGRLQNSDVRRNFGPSTVINLETSLTTIPTHKTMAPDLSVMAGLSLCPMLQSENERRCRS